MELLSNIYNKKSWKCQHSENSLGTWTSQFNEPQISLSSPDKRYLLPIFSSTYVASTIQKYNTKITKYMLSPSIYNKIVLRKYINMNQNPNL